jgi:hypothetical protein
MFVLLDVDSVTTRARDRFKAARPAHPTEQPIQPCACPYYATAAPVAPERATSACAFFTTSALARVLKAVR